MRNSNRILVVDDHPLTREGLSLAARVAVPGSAVSGVGTIAEASEVLMRWRSCRMVLLDFLLPDAHGYTGLLTLQCILPQTPLVIVSAREEMSLVDAAKALGAAGFLFKSQPLDQIASDLREIDAGLIRFPKAVAADNAVTAARRRIADLSPAQHSVLIALADGRSNKQIAYDLDITEATVKAHLTAIFRKLHVTNRSQALLAIQPILQAGAEEDGR